ncbi:hypothetical protein K492DRAFT_183929 [Lichtheimia hyalospora FSU 10163]|nr:hypothetical protein K492DRAFT_183929 [Lichtheimia hyalospora FSU 10163]
MNNYNNYNYNNSVKNAKNANTTNSNTHLLHHAVNQLSSNNPYNNTSFDNSFVPKDDNVFILPQMGDNGNNGHVSNVHELLNNGSEPEGPVTDMHHLALQQASQNVAAEVQIKNNKATYHQIYPNNPAFFLAQANSGESSMGSASSQNTAKAKRTEKLPKDISYLNTPFARNPDPAAKKVEFNTAEEWADKVERVMNYNGLDTKEHMNKYWRRIVNFALATQHAKRLTNELKENVDQLAGHDDYTWQQVRETIVMLFDTTAERHLHSKIINCCQQSNESLNSFVQRFSDLTYKAKLPQQHHFMRDVMFENMMPSTKQLAIDHVNMEPIGRWILNTFAVCLLTSPHYQTLTRLVRNALILSNLLAVINMNRY